MNIKTVQIQMGSAQKSVTLRAPTSPSLALEAAVLGAKGDSSRLRASFAALGLCWLGPSKLKSTMAGADYQMALYGQQVMDELIMGGAPFRELYPIAADCYGMLLEYVPDLEAVEEAEGFTDPLAEDSTPQ